MEVLSLPTAAAAGPAPAVDMPRLDAMSGLMYPPMPQPLAEADAAAAAQQASSDGSCSLACSVVSSEAVQQMQQQAMEQAEQQQAGSSACDGVPPEQRTHHLLKHCLSQTQRGSALQHFNTGDPRDAAKEIARMGQRELQAKFKEVYGSATKSNNNSWLRRKLYEAVGVAPLKANTKGKARKSAASSQRKSGGLKDKARAPKLPAAPKALPALKVSCPPSGGRGGSVGGGGMSILDLQQHSGLLSVDTSDSEDGSASHGNYLPAGLHQHSAPDSPCSPLGSGFAAFSGASVFGALVSPADAAAHQQQQQGQQQGQQAAQQQGQGQRRGLAAAPPAGFVPMPEPQSPLAPGLHWADGPFSCAAPAPTAVQQAQQPFLAAAPLEADVLLAGPAAPGPAPSHHFRPMELEQGAAQLWEGGACGACPASAADTQSWYFGSLDLSTLTSGGAEEGALGGALLGAAMMDSDMGVAAAAACCCRADDDDDIPLLTLDLGAIDVSI